MSEGTHGGGSYQRDNVIEHMSLANHHSHKSKVIRVHDVDVKMIYDCC